MNTAVRLTIVLGALLIAGCSSPNVNPLAPRADTGYVDFYTDSNLGLSWEVKRANEAGEMRTVFLKYQPVPGNIVRLAAPAGTHRFQVWFSNKVTTGPQTVEVLVANSKITPVHVALTNAGSSSVRSESYEYRNTRMGTRQVAVSDTEEKKSSQIELVAAAPQDYQPKERMPYFAKVDGG